MHHTATYCASHCNVLLIATHCNTLQHAATQVVSVEGRPKNIIHCNTLQHMAEVVAPVVVGRAGMGMGVAARRAVVVMTVLLGCAAFVALVQYDGHQHTELVAAPNAWMKKIYRQQHGMPANKMFMTAIESGLMAATDGAKVIYIYIFIYNRIGLMVAHHTTEIIYICTYIYIYIYICIYIYIHMCIYIYIYVYIHTPPPALPCTRRMASSHIHICIYTCIHVHICINLCIYI